MVFQKELNYYKYDATSYIREEKVRFFDILWMVQLKPSSLKACRALYCEPTH